jgi:DNA-binding NarL/FixJ family response regulator
VYPILESMIERATQRILERYRVHEARFDTVAQRRVPLGGSQIAAPPAAPLTNRLSVREAEVLQLVAEGLTNDEIAHRLWLSVETIETHLRSILTKLGAANRTHAGALGRARGLVSPAARAPLAGGSYAATSAPAANRWGAAFA